MLPTDRVRTSSAPCTTTALQENEYEIHNRHAFAHDIYHNRCGCAGWNRAWSPQVADHRYTAATRADDCFADNAAVEAFPAQVGIGFDDEIAANRSRQGAAFRSASDAHIRKAATKYLEEPAQAGSQTGCVCVNGIGCMRIPMRIYYLRDRAPALIRVFVAAVSVAPGRNSRNSPFDERLGPPDSQSSPIASRTTPAP